MFKIIARVGIIALALGALTDPARAQEMMPSNVKMITIGGAGVLADSQGMALYTFTNDKAGSGASACNGPCAQLWPPLMAPAGYMAAGAWSVISRQDGGKQLAYDGMPLYRYSKDKPGEDTGDGFRDLWHVAKPAN